MRGVEAPEKKYHNRKIAIAVKGCCRLLQIELERDKQWFSLEPWIHAKDSPQRVRKDG